MAYRDHPICVSPKNSRKVWRYLNFTQFISILENQSLHFSRADQFSDPYEGSLPKVMKDLRNESLDQYKDRWKDELLPQFREVCTKYTFLNCWHLNEHESAAMWDLYLETDDGVAIQSTYERLKNSLEMCEDHDIHISKVNYINYENSKFVEWEPNAPLGDTLSPFIHKRKSFEHEEELRAIIHELPWQRDGNVSWVTAEDLDELILTEDHLPKRGKYVPIDLDILIDSIYVAPHADQWIHTLINDVAKNYGLEDTTIEKSSIDGDPLY